MSSETPLDYALFQLSPERSQCEIFISSDGNVEKLASGLVQPFMSHLKAVEEQVLEQSVRSIKLEVEKDEDVNPWFTKGTLERFLQFVSTPEILESINTFHVEMSQLEAAQQIFSLGAGDQSSGVSGGDGSGTTETTADATKKELLRAIDVRLVAVRQDITMACTHASSSGFNPNSVFELQQFADQFGAHRLIEACTNFTTLCHIRPGLFSSWNTDIDDQATRASWRSDMSIDDPTEDQLGSHNFIRPHQPPPDKHFSTSPEQLNKAETQQYMDQSKPFMCSQFSLPAQRHNQSENSEEEQKEEGLLSELPTTQTSQSSRRLSVQDRIHLFEIKQEETSGGKQVAVRKSAELRRNFSDVSSAYTPVEKAVLRRWSGASDMIIDLGFDKKDSNVDRTMCAPSLSSVYLPRSNTLSGCFGDKEHIQRVSRDPASAVKVGDSKPKYEDQKTGLDNDDFELKNQKEQQSTIGSCWEKGDARFKENIDRNDQVGSHPSQTDSLGGEGNAGFYNEVRVMGQFRGVLGQPRFIDGKFQPASQINSSDFVGTMADATVLSDHSLAESHFRGCNSDSRHLSGNVELGIRMKLSDVHYKGSDGSSFTQGDAEVGKELLPPEKQAGGSEDPGLQRMKLQKSVSTAPEKIKKSQSRRGEINPTYGNSMLELPLDMVSENQESAGLIQKVSVEKVPRVRQSKGFKERNDELKLKAKELEKLFAEHKLRGPGDQSSSTRRRHADTYAERISNSHYRNELLDEVSSAQLSNKSTIERSRSTPPTVMVGDNKDDGDTLNQNSSQISSSYDSRGDFYERYMHRRDAKLREEWGSNRAEKEAKLKAMQDILELSRGEMKEKLFGSAGRADSVSSARWRAKRLRSFNSKSISKKEQSAEEEDVSDFLDNKDYELGRSSNELSFEDGASRSSQTRKLQLSRNTSSSIPRTLAAPVPRISAKVSSTSFVTRKGQSEIPLVQSVPNFSDLRKENTKPSLGAGKTTTRSQVRHYSRSKSTNENISSLKEEKPRRSQSLRKSSAVSTEFTGLSAFVSEDVLAPLQFEKEQSQQRLQDKLLRNVELKPSVRKGNSINPVSGTRIVKLKALRARGTEKSYKECDEVDIVKEELEEDFNTMAIEDDADIDNGIQRMSQSDKSNNSRFEIFDSLRALSPADPMLVSELPALEASWNSGLQNSFTYPHEILDIDASLNSHSLKQTESDAVKIRKRWGSDQKHIILSNSSHNHSRKDVTNGFKRLLKFGRKAHGTDSFIDWISATTTEGDDDTEDGRDPGNRPSDELSKSRMGFSHSHPSEDGFNESELINEQVEVVSTFIPAPPANFKLREDHMSGSSIKAPRSFFSVSTFRSKQSELKPR